MKKKSGDMGTETLILLIAIGFTAGVLSGLVGIGGGIIIVPALIFFLGFSQQEAQGTSLGLLLLPVGILAVINYYNKGYIDVKVVGVMCLAFVVGGWVGSKVALQLSEETVKKIFAIILLYTAFKMLSWDAMIVRWVKGIF
ncbi:MAG: sulfite exporter TauE/SafE family protein [Chitinophagaceae bacterium]|nr:sulfite exporter TauE/SafE family protein [Chitinophagaceae bacterium]